MPDNENDIKTNENDGPEGESRWSIERILKRISAIIAIIAAIIGGVALITNRLHDIKKTTDQIVIERPSPNSESEITPPVSPPTPVVSKVQSPKQCFEAKFMTPSVIPHYLLPSMGGSENFPYWLKIVGKNICDKKLNLKVWFEPKSGVVFKTDKPEKISFEAHKQKTWIVEPDDITLTHPEIPYIKILYSIKDDTGEEIDAGQIKTRIVPPYTVAWDLEKPKTPAGKIEPVDRAYLVASLGAWTKIPPRRVVKRARECRTRQGGTGRLIKEEALRSCYENLFWGDQAIAVYDIPIKLPDGKSQRIKPLSGVVEDKSATSLEAALLFAAVMGVERGGGDLVMIAAPVENDKIQKTVYIAWRDFGKDWKAIDLRLSSQKGFNENVTDASIRVNKEFSPEIRSAITGQGASFSPDEAIAVLHFKSALSEYGIWALPKVAPKKDDS